MARHVVARAADIPVGGRKLVKIDGRGVVVFNLKGDYYALTDGLPQFQQRDQSHS